MARFKLAVVLGFSAACFLGSADILYAQIVLSGGHFSNFHTSNIDPCTGTTIKAHNHRANMCRWRALCRPGIRA